MPNYLCRNRFGTYYFRFIIPLEQRELFVNRREIRRSLKTNNKRFAIRQARILRAQFDTYLNEILNMGKKDLKLEYIKFTQVINGVETNIEVDHDNDTEKETKTLNSILREKAKVDQELGLTSTHNNANTIFRNVGSNSKKLSVLGDDYLKLKKSRSKLTDKTIGEYRASYEKFIYIMGDKHIDEITIDDMESFYNSLLYLPRARKNGAKYRNKTFQEIKVLDLSKKQVLHVVTRNKAYKHIKRLLAFAVNKRLIDRNPANAEILETDSQSSKDKRSPFTNENLKTIFESPYFIKQDWKKGKGKARSEPYRFWIPLLALFTGARQAELLQLNFKDITKCEDNIHYINITDDFDKVTGESLKSIKNQNSKRKVPIHNTLIEIGFLDFVDSRKNTELFGEIKAKKNGIDAAQKVLNRTLQKMGVHEKFIKTFHSLRHTFITHALNKEVEPRYVGAISGHLSKKEFGEVAEIANTYHDGYAPNLLKKKVIDKVDYKVDFSQIKWR